MNLLLGGCWSHSFDFLAPREETYSTSFSPNATENATARPFTQLKNMLYPPKKGLKFLLVSFFRSPSPSLNKSEDTREHLFILREFQTYTTLVLQNESESWLNLSLAITAIADVAPKIREVGEVCLKRLINLPLAFNRVAANEVSSYLIKPIHEISNTDSLLFLTAWISSAMTKELQKTRSKSREIAWKSTDTMALALLALLV